MRGIAKAAWLTVLIALGACDVGVFGATDGGGGGGGGSDGGSNCAALVSPATPEHDHIDGTGTHANMACLASGCHGTTPGAGGGFAFAGTIYTDSTGTTPLGGGTVTVTAGSTTISAVSDAAGNFYYMTAATMPLPANTASTTCPTAAAMAVQIDMNGAGIGSTGGDCNACHTGTPTAVQTLKLYQ